MSFTRVHSKLVCDECGGSGYSGGSWMNKHNEHVNCPDCGKRVTVVGLPHHQSSMRMHGNGHELRS
jgi:hypothetical protein